MVTGRSLGVAGFGWAQWAAKKTGRTGWVLLTTAVVTLVPLVFEVSYVYNIGSCFFHPTFCYAFNAPDRAAVYGVCPVHKHGNKRDQRGLSQKWRRMLRMLQPRPLVFFMVGEEQSTRWLSGYCSKCPGGDLSCFFLPVV